MRNPAELYPPNYFIQHDYGIDPRREMMYKQEYERVRDRFLANPKRPPDGAVRRLLDVGCGLGIFTAQFNDRWEKYGVEISDFAAAKAIEREIEVRPYYCAYEYPFETFDLIIFRGTFQHLHEPMKDLRRCTELLKSGGMISFLATPNSNSPYYKAFGTLPALDPPRNFVIPSDLMLANILNNLGYEHIEFEYPYWNTPYQHWMDYPNFWLKRLGIKPEVKFAFPRSMMECHAWKI